jgi:hypothetical protein
MQNSIYKNYNFNSKIMIRQLLQSLLSGKTVISELKYTLLLFFTTLYLTHAQPVPVLEWQKTYTADQADFLNCWVETSDGYIIGGSSNSSASGMKTEICRGESDFWIIRLNKTGDKIWDKTFGSSGTDELVKILKTSDGFYLCGTSTSPAGNEKSQSNRGGSDFWIIKINNNGQKVWDKTIGGTLNDIFIDAVALADNSLVIAGNSNSEVGGDKASAARSVSEYLNDYWVVKLSASGNKIWDKSYGGATSADGGGDDIVKSILPTSDGGFVINGSSTSSPGLDKTSGGDSFQQSWIIKVNSEGLKAWDKSFNDGDFEEKAGNIIKTPDNAFMMTTSYGEYVDGGEGFDSYNNYIKLRKLNSEGNLLWEKSYGPTNGVELVTNISLASINPSGISILLYNSYADNQLFNFNFEGSLLSNFKIPFPQFPASFNYNSVGDLVLAMQDIPDQDWEYFLLKYKPVLNSKIVELQLQQAGDNLSMQINPVYYNPDISKVKFYVDGVEKGEDLTYPYNFLWSERIIGNHIVQAKAISKNGQIYSSEGINWKVFEFIGMQAEPFFSTVLDVGSFPVTSENAVTLNGGSSVRLWDIGDKIKYTFQTGSGKYKIKVYLRSGYYSSNSSNPTAYWPNGYTFSVNDALVKFTGDPSSLSGKNPAYGGSYWGTMISEELTFENGISNSLEIQANKQWLGVDYIEVIPVKLNRIEAETNFDIVRESGTKSIGTETGSLLSASSSVKLPDSGDEIYISFEAPRGNYKLNLRVRSGSYSSNTNQKCSYWPNGYAFQLDDNPMSMNGDKSSISGKTPAYGGSYWGTVKSGKIYLEGGLHFLKIKANKGSAGVDYLELEPVFESSNGSKMLTTKVVAVTREEVYPNPFSNRLYLRLSESDNEAADISLIDSYGKAYLVKKQGLTDEKSLELNISDLNLKPGVYILKVRSATGNKSYRIIKE